MEKDKNINRKYLLHRVINELNRYLWLEFWNSLHLLLNSFELLHNFASVLWFSVLFFNVFFNVFHSLFSPFMWFSKTLLLCVYNVFSDFQRRFYFVLSTCFVTLNATVFCSNALPLTLFFPFSNQVCHSEIVQVCHDKTGMS